MLTSAAFGTPTQARVVSYGQAHLDMADGLIDRLFEIARGNARLSMWERRQLLPIRRRTALRIAAKQFPYMGDSDVLAVLRIAKGR